MPLLTQAIRECDEKLKSAETALPAKTASTPFQSRTAVDRSEMLQKLKSEIFKNLHKQPSEIFSKTKRSGSPIKSPEVVRKRSKSDQEQPVVVKPPTPRKISEESAASETSIKPELAEVKLEPVSPPVEACSSEVLSVPGSSGITEKTEPTILDSDTDSLSDGEIVKPIRRNNRLKNESSQAKFARIINRRPLPPSKCGVWGFGG